MHLNILILYSDKLIYILSIFTSVLGSDLTPYSDQHGSALSYDEVHDCQKQQSGTQPHEIFPAHSNNNYDDSPLYKMKRFVQVWKTDFGTSKVVRGHYAVISNPVQTLSVLEPNQPGGCKLNVRQTVLETAKQKDCILAINAGYFNTKNGECHGNVISDGVVVVNSKGIQNAHFGLKSDGSIFTGYISEEKILNNMGGFLQLVGGVIWIIRNGTGYVNSSKYLECENTEETGSMDYFVQIQSSRTAVGHDADGRIVIVQVDGKSGIDGISLLEFQDFLLKLGLVNAINLDGGGSATFLINSTVVNYPYDTCEEDADFTCARKVSTALCVHYPECQPKDCNNHGSCSKGQCECQENWLPPQCDKIRCQVNNCSSNGICSSTGCICKPGYYGSDCKKSCPLGWFGYNCENKCFCLNNASCDPVTGRCKCEAGFIGEKCEHDCPVGFYGQDCINRCSCKGSCICNSINGSCGSSDYHDAYADCIITKVMNQQQNIMLEVIRNYKWAIYALCVVTFVSIVSALLFLFCLCKKNRASHLKKRKKQYHDLFSLTSSESEEMPLKEMEKL